MMKSECRIEINTEYYGHFNVINNFEEENEDFLEEFENNILENYRFWRLDKQFLWPRSAAEEAGLEEVVKELSLLLSVFQGMDLTIYGCVCMCNSEMFEDIDELDVLIIEPNKPVIYLKNGNLKCIDIFHD